MNVQQIKRIALGVIALAYCVNVPSVLLGQDESSVAVPLDRQFRQCVENIGESVGFSGVVLVADKGEIAVVVSSGYADQAAETPMEDDALFEIASCTKPFTAIAIMQLAEQGKLALDDPISKHLPDIPANCKAITIRHLLSHTSGIPGSNSNGRGDDVRKVIPAFLAGGPRTRPGSRYAYWNQGYSLLSEIIARASGTSYTATVAKQIFSPAGMTASCFTGDQLPGGFAETTGTSTRGPSRTALEHPYGSYGFQYRGMGGLVTNVQDLWNWDRALHSGDLLSAESVKAMTTAGQGGYGLGWNIATAPDGEPCHRHSGSVRGFVSEICRYPSIDGAIFVLSNSDDAFPVLLLRKSLEDLLFGKESNVNLPSPPPSEWTEHLVGQYKDDRNRTLVIEQTTGLPKIRINWFGPVTRGYIGMDKDDSPALYLSVFARDQPRFQADGQLKFDRTNARATSVTLGSLQPPLVFRRK